MEVTTSHEKAITESGVLATTNAEHSLLSCKNMKLSCNITHETGVIILEQLDTREKKQKTKADCDPERHQEKAEVQRVEKRKEITVGKKNRTMERESEEGSLN